MLELNLYKNKLGDEGIQMVSDSLQKYTNLIDLRLMLGSNDIGPTGIAKMSTTITSLELTHLQFEH